MRPQSHRQRFILPLVLLALVIGFIAVLESISGSKAREQAAQALPVPVPMPSTTPASAATAVPSPLATATASPPAVPGATAHPATPLPATAAPATVAPATPATAVLPPDAPPHILGVSLSSHTVSPGETVTGTVTTSSNVASVEARIVGYSTTLTKVGPGQFALSYRVPNLPPFLRHTYTVVVIARNTPGQSTSASVPITIH